MAIVRLGAIVNAMSGSIGATTFAHTKGGTVARALLRKPKNTKASQLSQRGFYAQVRRGWRFLTPAQQTAWGVAALQLPRANRLGQRNVLSGFALYVRLNTDGNLFKFPGIPIPFHSNPPQLNVLAAMIGSNFIMSLSDRFGVTIVAPTGLPQTVGSYYGARTHRDTQIRAAKSYRFFGLGFGPPPDIDFTSQWNSIIGPPELGELCFLKLRFAGQNALYSAPQIFSTFVVA